MSFFDNSELDNTQNGAGEDMDTVVDHAIIGLKKCLLEYKEKAKENNSILEKLGCVVSDLPPDIRKQLKDIYSDNEVYNFDNVGSKELVTINPCHILDCLRVNDQLAEMQRLKLQLDSILTQMYKTQDNLQRKLEIEDAKAKHLDEQANEKAVQKMVFKGKLENVERELKTMEKILENMEIPKYSLEEIKDLKDELAKLKEDLALTKTKLEKYNGLSLDEKEAANQLVNLQEELKKIDNEIKIKVDNCM